MKKNSKICKRARLKRGRGALTRRTRRWNGHSRLRRSQRTRTRPSKPAIINVFSTRKKSEIRLVIIPFSVAIVTAKTPIQQLDDFCIRISPEFIRSGKDNSKLLIRWISFWKKINRLFFNQIYRKHLSLYFLLKKGLLTRFHFTWERIISYLRTK